jgi:plasmid maintenance system antidote protein VapI
MQSTMELLDKALSNRYEMSATDWCKQLQINRTALSVSRARGRLSPTVAGNLARLLGEDEERWIAIAAIEAEPESYGKNKIISRMENWRKR